MYEKYNAEKLCRKILEDNGGMIADKARTILLEDPALKDLRTPLEFVSKNWRNPLTSAMIKLSCEAVGGQPEETHEVALAMSLMSLSVYLWDDIIDKAALKSFKPTLSGKFGEDTALVIGGLALAKAFLFLNQMNLDEVMYNSISKLLWQLWAKMSRVETVSLRLRSRGHVSAKKKFWKIKMEASDMETCLEIGAILGRGSEIKVKHLGRYGLFLGMILELRKDAYVSLNLTSDLAQRIRNGALPYSLLWASEHSEKILKKLANLGNKTTIEPSDIKGVVEQVLKTGAIGNTMEIIKKLAKKAKAELIEVEKNRATQTLQLFVEAQCSVFINSLSTLQADGN